MTSLKDMTLEDLWELFPIVLTPHRHQWSDWAKEEIEQLSELLHDYNPQISHIGSTAIPHIQAKPIIDIIVEIPPDKKWHPIKTMLEANGYICMSANGNRMSFNKGYTPKGYAERVFHIHIRTVGDHDEIYFRDYLNANPEIAHEYEVLKQSLLPRLRNKRDAYTEAKADFVRRTTADAKRKLAGYKLPPLRIEEISNDKIHFMPLLFIGDESEDMIDKYLKQGKLYVGFIGENAVAVCVTVEESENVTEIKNLAVIPQWQHKGIGRHMLAYIERINAGKTMTLGTGETPSTLRFYRSCGYIISHRIPNFLTDNYPAPIIEEGVQLRDMIYFTKQV